MNIIYRCAEDPLTINYRPKGTLPDWLDKRKCFKSLIDSLKNANKSHDIYVVHDGPIGPLEKYMKQFHVTKYINIDFSSNSRSQDYCIKLGKHLNGDTYFLEDDYLHLPQAIPILEEGINKFGLISGYDHIDRYVLTDDITYKNEEISLTESSHWRTAEATTCTWAASKEVLNIISDDALRFNIEDRAFFRHLYTEKRIRLWQTIPGVSTHITTKYRSPLIDWENFNNSIIL